MKSVLLQPTFTGAGPPVRSAPLDRLCDVDDDMMMIITCRPQGDEYNYEDYSDDNYYDTPDNYDYGDNYGDTCNR